ncbi:hypothetical protein [Aquimarina muelleri]|uniref:Uncharacterized protein n=1 Tax=Aquimarina muelleri TaxID=279356 RepID=A0A918JTP3_9FLAO|nr:hypothetical protein [Aquimarina muelleri]MCX2761336.1 hypothetical protein [Aquimarina muelleri]GGX12655.1 hypothetical protein GCM10007384_13070 [Aquimarina muelleri]
MSCHIQARWPQNNTNLNYNGDRYVYFRQDYGKDRLQLLANIKNKRIYIYN